jgi:hypothetical protein
MVTVSILMARLLDCGASQAKQVPGAGELMALRHFHPAMAGFCLQRNSAAALELDAFLTGQVCGCVLEGGFRLPLVTLLLEGVLAPVIGLL